ncbi:squalene epoxidase 3-like [Camellia sinensis]|uniref:squalene epoxidase 3-like n=1 Tax=Camellia sinensis TaxID=4442 RepID=UPI001036DC16|nr:squalene epoxidase 3-like [Camellia sinensis]
MVDKGTQDVIIVGAGVAGSALAHTLGKDGLQVHLIERNLSEPNRIAGELLQPGGYHKLIELGLQGKQANSTNNPIVDRRSSNLLNVLDDEDDVVVVVNDVDVVVDEFFVKMEQGTVTSLIEERGTIKGVEYKTQTGQLFRSYAPLTIVCDGCFSNLRRFLCKPKVDMISYFIGLIMECELPYPNHANLVLDGPTIMWFYPISSTEVRCLIDFPTPGTLPSISNGEMAPYLKTVVAPQIPPELYNAFILSVDKGEIRTMPINLMPATPYLIPGAVFLGDALNMRHAGTGSEMMVALHDIVLFRNLLRPLQKQLTDTA